MRISIHDIFIKLHKACNRLIILGVLVLCTVTGYLLVDKEAPSLEKNHSFAMLREDFLRAIRTYDIKTAKRLYALLKEKNPYAPFVEEAAPAYLADIYIHYAQQMAFNPQAATVFFNEARRLAPNHPLLATLAVPTAPVPKEPPVWEQKTEVLTNQIQETEKIVALETQAYVDELMTLEKTIEALEAERVRREAERLQAMLQQIETVELESPPQVVQAMIEPPAPGVMPLPPEEVQEISDAEKWALMNPDPLPAVEDPLSEPVLHHATDDACLLSFYTRSTPVSTCMDVVSDNQYGPSLFVIGDETSTPIAFTQQPITQDAFMSLCAETKACSSEPLKSQAANDFAIDLSDVEHTVKDYNAFCEMSQNCTGLVSATPPKLLEPNKLTEYVRVLSAKTGYPYRLMNEADVERITSYFQTCVEETQCDAALGSDLANFLKTQQGILLVREMSD